MAEVKSTDLFMPLFTWATFNYSCERRKKERKGKKERKEGRSEGGKKERKKEKYNARHFIPGAKSVTYLRQPVQSRE